MPCSSTVISTDKDKKDKTNCPWWLLADGETLDRAAHRLLNPNHDDCRHTRGFPRTHDAIAWSGVSLQKYAEVCRMLLEHGADVNAKNRNRLSPSLLASQVGLRKFCAPLSSMVPSRVLRQHEENFILGSMYNVRRDIVIFM